MVPYANDLRSPGFASMNTQADKGRAFFWALDTLSVGIRTSVDGKTRQVVSDGYFMGSPSGREARFVEVRVKLMPPLLLARGSNAKESVRVQHPRCAESMLGNGQANLQT